MMSLTPLEITVSKVWPMGLVVLRVSTFGLKVAVIRCRVEVVGGLQR